MEAQFSQYFAAAAAARGNFTWQSYALIDDPAVRDLMQRVALHPSDEVPQYGVKVTLTTRDGGRLSADHPLPKGEPELPMSQDEFDGKFQEWARPVLGDADTDTVTRLIGSLEDLDSIAELMRYLRARPGGKGMKEAAVG